MSQRAIFSVFSRISRYAIISLLAAIATTMAAGAADPQAPRHSEPAFRTDTPSGLPVPRYVSLKSEKTFCRAGPTFDHPVRITYQRKGLPVLVIAETRDHWRKIRDSEGDECWIHRAKLSGAQTALVVQDGLALRARPSDDAMQKARLGKGLVARVENQKSGWVQVSAGRLKGWAPQHGLWGATGKSR